MSGGMELLDGYTGGSSFKSHKMSGLGRSLLLWQPVSPAAKSGFSSFFCIWQELLSPQCYLREKDRVRLSFIEVSARFLTVTTLSLTQCDGLLGEGLAEPRPRSTGTSGYLT